jgi:hypothetical protein
MVSAPHGLRAEAVWLVSAVLVFIAGASVLWSDSFRRLMAAGRRGSIEDSHRQSREIPDHTPRGPAGPQGRV